MQQSKIFIIIALASLSISLCSAQNWIDPIYQISTVYDVSYGTSIDFKGANYTLAMDISFPDNDTPPACGRPLMIIVHGGAWYGGDKGEGVPVRIREDFARRGYVTASVNYRLGLFNSDQNLDCILEGWKCWNMTDTTEWYRANYRAIQDVHGAIRYLVNNKEEYNIDPENIFLTGESAGGFVVMGVGFMDDPTEVLQSAINDLPDTPPPHPTFEDACIRPFGLADNIDDMNLSKSSLGSYTGELNLPVETEYRIRGVANFYGGAFNNIFQTRSEHSPALYLFHQPCDLIVPFNSNKLLAGYNACAIGFPTFCQNIVNRSTVYGSGRIVSMIDEMKANNIPTCDYQFDNPGTNYSCAEQILNPGLACHSLDNYELRSKNVAIFFAEYIEACSPSKISETSIQESVRIYPNPVSNDVHIDFENPISRGEIKIQDLFGRVIHHTRLNNFRASTIDLSSEAKGLYQITIRTNDTFMTFPFLKI